jgi:hypothetical protein
MFAPGVWPFGQFAHVGQMRWSAHMARDRLRRSIKLDALLVNEPNPSTSRGPAAASIGSSKAAAWLMTPRIRGP